MAGHATVLAPAQAQIPDAGSQRFQIIDELKSVNAKMDKLIALLQDGQIQVRLANPGNAPKPAPAR